MNNKRLCTPTATSADGSRCNAAVKRFLSNQKTRSAWNAGVELLHPSILKFLDLDLTLQKSRSTASAGLSERGVQGPDTTSELSSPSLSAESRPSAPNTRANKSRQPSPLTTRRTIGRHKNRRAESCDEQSHVTQRQNHGNGSTLLKTGTHHCWE